MSSEDNQESIKPKSGNKHREYKLQLYPYTGHIYTHVSIYFHTAVYV